MGCVSPQAEPAPSFALWYAVGFQVQHTEQAHRETFDFYKLSFEAEAKILYIHSDSKQSFSKPVSFAGGLPAPAPRGYFLMKRKYPKIHKEPVGSLTSNGRGNSPFDPPSGESSFARFSRAMTAKVIFC